MYVILQVKIEELVAEMGGVLHTKTSLDLNFVIVKNVLARKYKVWYKFLSHISSLFLIISRTNTYYWVNVVASRWIFLSIILYCVLFLFPISLCVYSILHLIITPSLQASQYHTCNEQGELYVVVHAKVNWKSHLNTWHISIEGG